MTLKDKFQGASVVLKSYEGAELRQIQGASTVLQSHEGAE